MDSYMGTGSYPRFGTHSVRVTFQCGEYKGEILHSIGGNCLGCSILSTVVSDMEDGDFEPDMSIEVNQKHIEMDTGDAAGYPKHYRLYNDAGDELLIDYADIVGNVTGVQIIGWEAEKR